MIVHGSHDFVAYDAGTGRTGTGAPFVSYWDTPVSLPFFEDYAVISRMEMPAERYL